jgi:hypothetical protein
MIDEQPESDAAPAVRPPLAENRMLTRALRLGWPVPDDLKQLALKRMAAILENGKSVKANISATKVLLSMERAEQTAIMALLSVEAQTELKSRIEALEQGHVAGNVAEPDSEAGSPDNIGQFAPDPGVSQ